MMKTVHSCIIPQAVQKKFSDAEKNRMPLYIYGATGYGKTSIVKEYLKKQKYLYITQNDYDRIPSQEENRKTLCVVIDDLQQVNNVDMQMKIQELMVRDDLVLVLISRAPMPGWLLSGSVKTDMMVINEADLKLLPKDIHKLCSEYGVTLSDEICQLIHERSEGNGFVIHNTVLKMIEGSVYDQKLVTELESKFVRYLEMNILRDLDEEVLEFLVQISIVDSFTLKFAEYITGNSKIISVIQRAQESGNFLYRTDDVYYMRPFMIVALRNYARKEYGSATIKEYKLRAGLYYELHEDVLSALKIYDECGERKYIRQLLISHARNNPSNGHYYELRKYYEELNENEVTDSPVLMAALSMLYSMTLRPEKSEYWYDKLKEYSKSAQLGHRKEALSRLAYLDIGLPHRGINNLSGIFTNFYQRILMRDFSIPEFSVTSNLPSVMNGGKDFSEWSKHDIELAKTIGKPVSAVLGKYGKGLVNLSLGESFFEKGTDDFSVFSYLNKAHLETDISGKLELQFAVVGLQVRMGIIHGELTTAFENLNSFSKKVNEKEYPGLYRNLKALNCRLALYSGNEQVIRNWTAEAPNENESFFAMERYRYMTKIRCYIKNSQYVLALSLLERLLYYAEQYCRPYQYMEAKLFEAVVHRKTGFPWQQGFKEVLNKAYEYHFVRIISQEGIVVLPLLKEFKKEYREEQESKRKWFQLVMDETEKMAEYYPTYMDGDMASVGDFSENAIEILKMQANGMTVKEIAGIMKLSEATIKYHTKETYRKLNVGSKIDAVQKARQLKII